MCHEEIHGCTREFEEVLNRGYSFCCSAAFRNISANLSEAVVGGPAFSLPPGSSLLWFLVKSLSDDPPRTLGIPHI